MIGSRLDRAMYAGLARALYALRRDRDLSATHQQHNSNRTSHTATRRQSAAAAAATLTLTQHTQLQHLLQLMAADEYINVVMIKEPMQVTLLVSHHAADRP